MIDYLNEKLNSLPPHLKKFMVPQEYESYTPVNHAVWRYVMRQNVNYLSRVAHASYMQGLARTGITLDRIPSIKEMNEILGKIGWAACTVDGFIHPQAFMEFQEHRVLVVAADIRQINHIEYTPAPDIIHEAAGHAPIIADKEYAEYLRLFGEIGRKAFSSGKDFELFEAIRHLSILKEDPYSNPDDIKAVEAQIEDLSQNLGEPSEMALIRRLHWWTVEYGLIGSVKEPRIYGAGLLSSIGESVGCMKDDVKKIPYSLEAMNVDFDITKPQPQLYVASDFKQLSAVLEQFAETMALRRGGAYGLGLAKDSRSVATAVYASSLAVTGVLADFATDADGNPAYLWFTGPVSLSDNARQLPNHGTDYHKEGFGSPCGKLKGSDKAPEDMSDGELADLGIKTGRETVLEFASGVKVTGYLESSLRHVDGKLMLLSFSGCTVVWGDRILFRPEWGIYDMAVGASIVSVYAGVPDPWAYTADFKLSDIKTHKIQYDEKAKELFALYGQIREIRNNRAGYEQLDELADRLENRFPDDWLANMEILEIVTDLGIRPELKTRLEKSLQTLASRQPELEKLIGDGLRLLEK